MSKKSAVASAKSADEPTASTIHIKGARTNNLRNIELHIPKDQLVVVTGLSGSGKSSLTMDTLYAEGQRRYVESLSSYARQFLGRMKKPEVDFIKGICPAIAIEQKVSTRNARSTVGTLTELYDYLRMLYARVGKTISPVSGREVKRHTISDVVDFLLDHELDTKFRLLVPVDTRYADRTLEQELSLLVQKGYVRLQIEGELQRIEAFLASGDKRLSQRLDKIKDLETIQILIDRFRVSVDDPENDKRIADSVQTAFLESGGEALLQNEVGEQFPFNNRFELDGIQFLDPTPQLFNYNNPYGACPSCEGFGRVMGIDENKVIPNFSLSVYDGAVAPWKGDKHGRWLDRFLKHAHTIDFPVHTPYHELNRERRRQLWKGAGKVPGIHDFFERLREKTYKIQNRVMLARYRGRTFCSDCDGGRLREEATWVRIGGQPITTLIELPIDELLSFFRQLAPQLSAYDQKIASRILLEVTQRLEFMCDVGLEYLTLNRISSSLSGGETQRINLTRTLGSNLTASLYVLDEPSIGLHPRDTNRLVGVLQRLRNLGNTVVVVEHEEDIIKHADYLIDIGPGAGIHGGEVVFAGPYEQIYKDANDSLTAGYMSGRLEIPLPEKRRTGHGKIVVEDARQHNLTGIDVTFPLQTLTVVSGVSGSGKTTLVKNILYPAMKRHLGENTRQAPGQFGGLLGDMDQITQLELVNQNPIGKSSRSNPVTYVKAYDSIRSLMAQQQLSYIRGFQPRHFSFNVDGGRCDACKGEGEQVIEMQFLADVRLLCEVCEGKRFKQEVLDVTYKGKNIADILALSVEEALDFFVDQKDVLSKIQPLADVGLGYVQLGQSSSTLSGGEAQRVKLASFLSHDRSNKHILFIFDEPTTGLHFHDIRKLLQALNALVDNGNTVIVVEHNMEVIKSADWVIDLGPGGGRHGGHLVFEGTPEELVQVPESYTGQFLAEKLT